MTSLTKKELLAQSLARHHVLQRASRLQVVSGLCGLQAQFATSPREALRIRARDYTEGGWGRGLVKIWSHRGTIHVVPASELGLHLSARGNTGSLTEAWHGWGIPLNEVERWADVIRERAAAGMGEREELKRACVAAGMAPELVPRIFNGWGGLLKEMCDRGMLVYEAGTSKRFTLPPEEPIWMPRDEARAMFVRRYFEHFGPATIADCAAFLGYPSSEVAGLVRRAGLPLRKVACDGIELFYLGDLDPEARVPGCVYLAGFDQLVLGYRNRSRFARTEDLPHITNRAGIVFPIVLYRGRVCARWKLMGKRLSITEFRPLSQTARDAIAARGRRLFAGRRIVVGFQTEADLPAPKPFNLDTLPSALRGSSEG